MTTILAILGHLLLNFSLGWSIVKLHPAKRHWGETVTLSLMVGIHIGTLLIATLMFLGTKLTIAVIVASLFSIAFVIFSWKNQHFTLPSFKLVKPKWYEWLMLFAVGEKLLFITWQIFRNNLHFDDAMNHWAARAHSLYGGVNWSFDPDSPLYLGAHIAFNHYPLGTIVWSATTAVFNGSWNDILARFEGLVLFSITLVAVWLAVWRFSQTRWLAAFATFTVSALPLQVWHAASGYSETAVGAYGALALAALLRKEWFFAGMMVAGAAWSKNDGLALFMPAILVGVGLWQFSLKDLFTVQWFSKEKWFNIGWCFLGIATLAPWTIYKQINSLKLSQHGIELDWRPDAPQLFWDYVMMGPTNSILWLCLFLLVIGLSPILWKDQGGRALSGVFWTLTLLIFYIFSFTSAYEWLKIQTTVHRTMLQFSGIAVIVAAYSIWLTIRSVPSTHSKGLTS